MQEAMTTLEVETKYEAPDGAPLPTNFSTAGLAGLPAVTYELRATYFDGPDFELAGRGMALRRRAGGSDQGWHLKKRNELGNDETTWPLTEQPPAELAAFLAAAVPNFDVASISAIADIATTRTEIDLADASGKTVCTIFDDVVVALDHLTGVSRAWREWEAELAPGTSLEVLAEVDLVMRGAGARVSPSHSKIVRARGLAAEVATSRGAPPHLLAALAVSELGDRMAGLIAGKRAPATARQVVLDPAFEADAKATQQITKLREIAFGLLADT